MSNRSYCRFQNTLEDLRDCVEQMKDKDLDDLKEDLSPNEFQALEDLLYICSDLNEEFGDDV